MRPRATSAWASARSAICLGSKKLTGRFDGIPTGKGLNWGGSLARTEATGYGLVYFTQNMLQKAGLGLEGKKCSVGGSGNVAIYAIAKLYQAGALPIAASDSNGYVYDAEGIDLAVLKELKEARRARLSEYVKFRPSAKYVSVSETKKAETACGTCRATERFRARRKTSLI